MAVLFCWENRPYDSLTLENLRLATELPENELRRTLWGLVAFPKLKRQVLMYDPPVAKPQEFTESTKFRINHDFGIIKNGKLQKRGKINLIGRLQLSTEKARKEENEGIIQLRILRTQEAIIKSVDVFAPKLQKFGTKNKVYSAAFEAFPRVRQDLIFNLLTLIFRLLIRKCLAVRYCNSPIKYT